MNLVKNNLQRIILAGASFACFVLMLIPTFMSETFDFIGACQSIGFIVFFAGVVIVLLLKIFEKTKVYSKFVLIVTGGLTLTFLLIGLSGISKTDSKGVIGKSYAYFAIVETTVKEGEILIAGKQAEMDAKKTELEAAKVDIASLGLLIDSWQGVVVGYTTPGLFGIMNSGTFEATIDPASTELKNIVANPAIDEANPAYATVAQLIGMKSKLVAAGLGGQTLMAIPYVIGGIVTTSAQMFPQLEEAIAQLQGVIDMNAAELAVGKAQVKDANAAAATILYLYISLIIGMGAVPIFLGAKEFCCKECK